MTNQESDVLVTEAQSRLQALFNQMWASKTTSSRQNLWRRLAAWTSSQGLPINADTAALFVTATGVQPQGQLTYAKALSAIFGKMGYHQGPLLTMASALRSSGAAIPINQQTPIPRETLVRWAGKQEPSLRLCTYVAWKTASRWGEVWKLTSSQFILVTETEVIVDWWTTPKGKRGNPFKASRFAVIKGQLTKDIAELYNQLQPFDVVCSVNTDALDLMWSMDSDMAPYRGHSIKRGAMCHLLEQMDSGVSIPDELLDRLTKHEHPKAQKFSASTMGYGTGNDTKANIAMARVLGTGRITPHL